MGEFETLGFTIGVLSEDIALFHALYRTSILGRKNFIDFMFSDDNDPTAVNKLNDVYTSRVAEVFSVILKSLSLAFDFVEERNKPHVLSDENVKVHRINEKVYVCSDYQFYLIQNLYDIREKILTKYPVITKSTMDNMVKQIIAEDKYIDDAIVDDLLKTYFQDTQELINKAQDSISEAVREFDGTGGNCDADNIDKDKIEGSPMANDTKTTKKKTRKRKSDN